MQATRKAFWQIHFCVLLWGFTGIFGRLIALSTLPLVWWRMLLVVVVLACVPSVWRSLRGLSPRALAALSGVGVLVALHWLTFYGSIKLANASVGASCMALATVFTALAEPVLTRTRFFARDILLGILVIPGVVLVVGGVPEAMHIGIVVGTISAIIVAIFGSLNKRLVDSAPALTVTAVELGAGTLTLTVAGALLLQTSPATLGGDATTGIAFAVPGMRDAIYLLILALACTLLPFALSLVALRHMSAFAVQLAVNLEPVYTIVLAIILLGEHRELSWPFYAGVSIIIGAVCAYPLLQPKPPGERTPAGWVEALPRSAFRVIITHRFFRRACWRCSRRNGNN